MLTSFILTLIITQIGLLYALLEYSKASAWDDLKDVIILLATEATLFLSLVGISTVAQTIGRVVAP